MYAKLIASVALLAAVSLGGAARAADSCVWIHELDDFKSANDEKSMMIADSPSHKYTVTFHGRCLGLRFTEAIAVRSVGGMFCLTPGDFVSFSDNGIRQRCMIDTITPLAPKPDDSAQTQSQPSGY